MTDPPSMPPTLREVTESLAVEVRGLRTEMRMRNVLIAVAICALGYVTWQNHVTNEEMQVVTKQNQAAIAESNRMWCPVLGAIIQPDGPPPTTERSRIMVDLLSDLFVSYGCTPADLPDGS